ncbi:MAG: hypothetical protein SOW55_05355 [Bacilli bacterium]|nr:hypothetical protein [Bacillales bacterium]MDY2575374.1 hypothetical protein [Bacilli bacterium]
MKKSVKIALKRFLVLLICLVMVLTLFFAMDNVDKTVRLVVGISCLVVIIAYWIFALISIRRDNQRKKRDEKK